MVISISLLKMVDAVIYILPLAPYIVTRDKASITIKFRHLYREICEFPRICKVFVKTCHEKEHLLKLFKIMLIKMYPVYS